MVHDKPKRILFFSLEMDEPELVQRLLSIETHIDQAVLADGKTTDHEDEEVKRQAKALKKLDMRIVDRTDTFTRIKSEARAAHLKRSLDLIIIDYLQLIVVSPDGRAKNELRHEEVARISKGLKKLSRELKVPILALAQLNRKSEDSEVPQLTHLGESDQIVRDADCVMFIHCDESELDKRNNSQPYRLNIIVRKHRNGRLGQASLMFRPHLTRFDDLAEEEG
jgi:replicative DNA helicase